LWTGFHGRVGTKDWIGQSLTLPTQRFNID
jgi:hypothetical protein